MTDFLLELRSEEIPARMQAKAREDLAKLFAAELAKAGIAAGEVVTYATPRRLALIARALPLATEPVREETKGPRVGAPPQALEGFLRKTGLTADQLVERDGTLFAIVEKPGRATADVLAQAIPAIVRVFPWPKSMRWGDASISTESLRWVRPLQGIVALLGDQVVPCEVAGIASGNTTVGHRFHAPGDIAITSAATYADQLRDAHVIVDPAERAAIIATGSTMAAQKAGLVLVRDEGLLAENAGLTEWPVPLLGRFDPEFLTVPPEVIQLTARVNQKYFVCHDGDGRLADAFVCVANIDAEDGGAKIVEGNRKVLAARLSDARFFYETDLKTKLEDQLPKLQKIVFHEKLGTVADKVERVAKLARWLVEQGIVKSSPQRGEGDHAQHGGGGVPQAASSVENPLHRPAYGPPPRAGEELAALAERAARLAKADLVTGMVGEFPELQGLMGGYYAAAQGEDPRVAAAIRDHYKPVGQGDDVPTDPVTVAVALADKLDTIASFFAVGDRPTGSKDPFALRRSANGVIAMLLGNRARLPVIAATRLIAAFALARTEADGSFGSRLKQAIQGPLQHIFGDFEELTRERWGLQVGQMDGGDKPRDILSYEMAAEIYEVAEYCDRAAREVLDFFADRLKVQQREAGVRHDLIDAVFALGGEDDLVRLLARVRALQAFVETENGANLLAGYKRAANILKKEGVATPVAPAQAGASGDGAGQQPQAPTPARISLSYTPEPAEHALIEALDSAEPRARAAVEAEDFEGAMAALASLRAPIDAFFDSVTVNDADADKRAARLGLLARVRDAVHAVADFSKIEG